MSGPGGGYAGAATTAVFNQVRSASGEKRHVTQSESAYTGKIFPFQDAKVCALALKVRA